MPYLSLIIVVLFGLLEAWMWRHRKSAGISKAEKEAAMSFLPVLMIMIIIILLAAGGYIASLVQQEANHRLEEIVKGIAPTLAYELSERGHSLIRSRYRPG